MSRLSPLPVLMLAPNGARRDKGDHPGLPMSVDETVAAARAAFEAGAQALHAHVRDVNGAHSLDPDAYKALIAAMARAVPDMAVQITTEAVGRFTPAQQRETVLAVNPEGASVALREMWPEGADDLEAVEARAFYATCAQRGIPIQHICYTPADLTRLLSLTGRGDIPGPVQAIFVLGAYATDTPAAPEDLDPFLDVLQGVAKEVDWAVCAFGPRETECLVAARRKGGKMRIGFENNLHQSDGSRAPNNAARVAELIATLDQQA